MRPDPTADHHQYTTPAAATVVPPPAAAAPGTAVAEPRPACDHDGEPPDQPDPPQFVGRTCCRIATEDAAAPCRRGLHANGPKECPTQSHSSAPVDPCAARMTTPNPIIARAPRQLGAHLLIAMVDRAPDQITTAKPGRAGSAAAQP